MVDFGEPKQIYIADDHPLMDKEGLFHREFPSDYRQIRYFTLLVTQKAPPELRELNLLSQQVSELIKNAVKHGNKRDPRKKIRVWWSFSSDQARLIVEDEGQGFTQVRDWNKFNVRRTELLRKGDFTGLADYVAYTTPESDEMDGGNALFAAVEYWDQGVVFTKKANCVAVGKRFARRTLTGGVQYP